jgi:hypothetical protein
MGKLWAWYPPIGVYIAVLAFLGVLVPFFRDISKIGKREKAVWTAIMFLLVFLEIKSIYQDRNTHENEQSNAREEQLKEFQTIADGIDRSLINSQQQFNATMGRINTTLATSERTLRNTIPTASLEFQEMRFYGPSLPIKADQGLTFNIWFTNNGGVEAKNTHVIGNLYARKAHDSAAEAEIVSDLQNIWSKKRSTLPKGQVVKPREPTFVTLTSGRFTASEVEGVIKRSLTLYLVLRFIWTDQTGQWATNVCWLMQDPMHDLSVMQPCKDTGKYRYPFRY